MIQGQNEEKDDPESDRQTTQTRAKSALAPRVFRYRCMVAHGSISGPGGNGRKIRTDPGKCSAGFSKKKCKSRSLNRHDLAWRISKSTTIPVSSRHDDRIVSVLESPAAPTQELYRCAMTAPESLVLGQIIAPLQVNAIGGGGNTATKPDQICTRLQNDSATTTLSSDTVAHDQTDHGTLCRNEKNHHCFLMISTFKTQNQTGFHLFRGT